MPKVIQMPRRTQPQSEERTIHPSMILVHPTEESAIVVHTVRVLARKIELQSARAAAEAVSMAGDAPKVTRSRLPT